MAKLFLQIFYRNLFYNILCNYAGWLNLRITYLFAMHYV